MVPTYVHRYRQQHDTDPCPIGIADLLDPLASPACLSNASSGTAVAESQLCAVYACDIPVRNADTHVYAPRQELTAASLLVINTPSLTRADRFHRGQHQATMPATSGVCGCPCAYASVVDLLQHIAYYNSLVIITR